MTVRADIVTVYHNPVNHAQHLDLFSMVARYELDGGLRLIGVDNRVNNRGFAAGCNLGAFHPDADAPIIGFLNPDVHVNGPFVAKVAATLDDTIVITGSRFGKPQRELDFWGVHDWVCGAALFVRRDWFTAVGGFDVQFEWSHEESDLIRQAQTDGRKCKSIALPLEHTSPVRDTPEDVAYKQFHFTQAQRRYIRKWSTS